VGMRLFVVLGARATEEEKDRLTISSHAVPYGPHVTMGGDHGFLQRPFSIEREPIGLKNTSILNSHFFFDRGNDDDLSQLGLPHVSKTNENISAQPREFETSSSIAESSHEPVTITPKPPPPGGMVVCTTFSPAFSRIVSKSSAKALLSGSKAQPSFHSPTRVLCSSI
jgi:hypothetical protein